LSSPINLAVLLSGSGRTLQNFIDRIQDGSLNAQIRVVISSEPDAYGLERAKKYNIPATIARYDNFNDGNSFSEAITEQIERHPVDLIAMAGFIRLYRIPDKFLERIMNIHPGLIPAFCGKGYYGERVHKAVLEYGAKVSGCTVHFADNVYDRGPIIVQRAVPVFDHDTVETLAERVFEEECIAYPEAIRLFADGRLKIDGRKVKILP
jgi:formyltetrahydrofolate-dependent phosphoribosylglycinamide formyltransferase